MDIKKSSCLFDIIVSNAPCIIENNGYMTIVSFWKKLLPYFFIYPFNAQEDTGVPFHRNFNSILRRDHQKNFL